MNKVLHFADESNGSFWKILRHIVNLTLPHIGQKQKHKKQLLVHFHEIDLMSFSHFV